MKQKDLKIDFRYLTGNIACLSVDSIGGESVHNDINDEEAIIIFNSLVGEKENCQTVKTLLKENQELKKQVEEYRKTNEHLLDKKRFLKQENQLLKKQLEEANKKLYLCTPEIPQNIHKKYVSYVDLVNEMYELKKQLEDKEDFIKKLQATKDRLDKYNYKITMQQQEFIKYLEDEIQSCEAVSDLLFNSNKEMKVYKEILQKYKSIIGGNKDDN